VVVGSHDTYQRKRVARLDHSHTESLLSAADTVPALSRVLHGLNPTVRLAEFEVSSILNGQLTGDAAKVYMERLLCERLKISSIAEKIKR